jgi:hypothetical protein
MLGVAVAVVTALGGCTTVRHTFAGHDADQVWAAMVTVAERPRYDDWNVAANDVWIDESKRRIEIHRDLHRVLYRPRSKPLSEQRTWQLEARLFETDPPKAKLISRSVALPSHARIELRRYFADVMDLLSGLPAESAFQPRDRDLLDALGLDESGADLRPEE